LRCVLSGHKLCPMSSAINNGHDFLGLSKRPDPLALAETYAKLEKSAADAEYIGNYDLAKKIRLRAVRCHGKLMRECFLSGDANGTPEEWEFARTMLAYGEKQAAKKDWSYLELKL
jgi:hypothetical protein